MGCLLCKIFGHKNSYFQRTDGEEQIIGFVCRRCYMETKKNDS